MPHFSAHFPGRLLAFGAAFFVLAAALRAQTIPAFPGAEGFGAYAKGGRGGDVYHVTNLNSSGVGSFADAIATVPSAGRTIVFDVSGYIRFPSGSNGTRMTTSKVTIAGQTAPGDGVGFYNNFFRISGDDIVIRHLRFRMGKYGSGGDCIDLDSGSLNSILDHVSMQFSTDENMSSFGSPPENLTLQYSLNSWGLESHSCGGLWDQNHATSHHNLWSHNHTRNPKARPNGLLEWVNNVTFDWDIGFIMGDSTSNASWKANVISNYFIGPAGNTHSKALVKGTVGTNLKPNFTVYLSGNLIDLNGNGLVDGGDNGYGIVEGTGYPPGTGGLTSGAAAYYQATGLIDRNAGTTQPGLPVTTDTPLVAYKKIVSAAGALRLDAGYTGGIRDEVDTILLNKLTSQTHFHVTRESDTGASASGFGTLASAAAPTDTDRDGMPDFYEKALASVGWNSAVDDHNTALPSSGGIITGTTFFPAGTVAGYTRLEEYLHFLAIPHGALAKNVTGTPSSIAVDMRKFTGGFSAAPTFTVANVSGGTVALSGTGNAIATFTPTLDYVGRARFDFTVTDSAGSTWTQTCALVVTNSGLPRDLIWKGDGAANNWDETSLNWTRNGAAADFNAGDVVTFDNTGALAVTTQGALPLPSAMVVDASGNYTFGGTGSITASGPLTKRGAGTLTFLDPANSFASATIEAGTVTLGVGGGISGGTFTLLDGAAFVNLYSASQPTVAMPFDVPAGNSATIATGNRVILSGAVTGAGTLTYNVQTTVTRADLKGAMAAFTGALNFTGSGGVRLYFNGGAFNGFDGASVDLGGSVSLQPQSNSGGNTLNIGALSGASAAANLSGGTAGAVAYVVGANGTGTSYAGSITGNATFTKTGAGALTLTGPTSYTGATTVSAGDLIANGVLGASAITVASGAKLRGAGSIAGAVTMQAGAQLSPGAASSTVGTLTLGSAGLSLANMTVSMQLSGSPGGANDKVHLTGGSLDLTGALTFTFTLTAGSLAAGDYFLVDGAATGTASGVTFAHNIPNTPRQTFTIPPAVAGQTFIKLVVAGDPATLTWKGSINGVWDAATTANWLNGAAADSFQYNDGVVLDDTATTRTLTLTGSLLPRSVIVNTALGYTLGGAGTLDGTASLVKNGAGTLTLAGSAANTFSGGLTLNAGTIQLANDAANAGALGTGPVTLNGGAISMHDDAVTYNSFTANLVVPAGATAQLNADSRVDLYGTLTGAGTLNFFIPYIRTTLFTDWSAFTGVINVFTDASGGDFRMGTSYSFPGFPLATVVLADKVAAYYTGTLSSGAGTTIELGELAGGALSGLAGGATGGRNFTYRIGGKTLAGNEVVFAGSIYEQNTGTATSYVKTGAGTWTLSGPGAWNGGTVVEQGILKITGTVTCGAATDVAPAAGLSLLGGTLTTDALNIASGAVFTGSGTATLHGDFNNNGTATLVSGTFAVTGDAVNNGTLRFTGGAALAATGAFVNNGLLDLLTGAQTLPANLENNGLIIDSSSLRMTSAAKAGNTVTVTAQTYAAHTYQLQRADALIAPVWGDIAGQAFTGNGSPHTFTDTAATGVQRFYRIRVTP